MNDTESRLSYHKLSHSALYRSKMDGLNMTHQQLIHCNKYCLLLTHKSNSFRLSKFLFYLKHLVNQLIRGCKFFFHIIPNTKSASSAYRLCTWKRQLSFVLCLTIATQQNIQSQISYQGCFLSLCDMV